MISANTKVRREWDDTRIAFDISRRDGKTVLCFTHIGLKPADECYESCSDAWGALINGSLRKLITTGKDQPNIFAKGSEQNA